MLNIAICDDDIQITGKIERLLQDIAKRNFVDTEIEVFWNGKSLADAIAAGERYDVIYLDIEMDKEDGISAARRIRTYDKNVRIIYVTSHESYMRESFEVRPFQFLVKPVTDKIMEKCFKSVYEDINSEDFYFRYSYQRMNHKVPIKDILYFESNKRKIFIVTEQDNNKYPLELFVAWGIILVSSICIWKLSPVENINHELKKEEKEHCRKVTGKILGAIFIAAGCCTALGMKKYLSLIALTALTVFISQCIGIIKYKVEKEKN